MSHVDVTHPGQSRRQIFSGITFGVLCVIAFIGLYDSSGGMIFPLLVDAAGVFIMKNFFDSIPVAVEEAARIDGAGTFRIFWSIVLPMARFGTLVSGALSSGNQVPDQAGRRGADDHPGRRAVLRVPEADHEHHRRRREGLTEPTPTSNGPTAFAMGPLRRVSEGQMPSPPSKMSS